jgi:transposase
VSGKEMEEQVWWTVGVDCGEERHRFVLLDEHGRRVDGYWVDNRSDRIEEGVARAMLALPGEARLRLATEGLRSLGWVLVKVAVELGVQVWQVKTVALNHYRELEGQPRKDDDIDGYLAARMVHNKMEGCHLAVDPRPEERALCRLSRLRSRQLKLRTSAKNRLRSRLLELAPEAVGREWTGPVHNGKGMHAVLRRWPAFDGLEKARSSTIEKLLRGTTRYGSRCSEMANELKEMAGRIRMDPVEREAFKLELRMALDEVEFLGKAIAELEKELAARVVDHPVGRKLLAMPGVGVITAASDIGEVLPVARNVSEGKAATYVGLTPLSRLSGKGAKNGQEKKPSKLARGVNKYAATANYLSAIAAISKSAIDAAYHRKQMERHRGHPKPHVKATLALARQRFKVKYKLMTTDAVYDKEILIASHLERLQRDRERSQSTAA